MIQHKYTFRVRYEDTDKMEVVYHGRYISYFEFARTEMVRDIGFSYRRMEEMGILLPVTEINIKFRRPARYDDLITCISTVEEMPNRALTVIQKIVNADGVVLVNGSVRLHFVDQKTKRPVRIPTVIRDVFEQKWNAGSDE